MPTQERPEAAPRPAYGADGHLPRGVTVNAPEARPRRIYVNQPPPSSWKRLARIRWIRGTLEALYAVQGDRLPP
ncbi:MAG TPA: hypothetical protein VFE05_23490 [Longimicrobiaceae bacterium]|jgi:hypothetical protein|nr:hypothetical protein [Longimicrobiaceae bacterium]